MGMNNSISTLVRIMAIIMLCAIPISLSAQAKPKRDVTKDMVSVPKSQKVPKTAKRKKSNHYLSKSNNRRRTKRTRNESYNYLTVNNTDNPNINIGYEAKYFYITVQTNRRDWTCGNSNSSWYIVNKIDGNKIEVSVAANKTGEVRKGSFWVSSGDKGLWVYINQESLKLIPKAVIDYASLEHGRNVMSINVQASIENAKNKSCFVECWLTDAYGNYAVDNKGQKITYYSESVVTPQSDYQKVSFTTLVPNILIPAEIYKKTFKWIIVVCCIDNGESITSQPVYREFKATKKRKRVKTED